MNRKSFTLVELLVTIIVAVLVISGVLMSLINSMVLNEYNQQFSIAMNVARARLEEVISNRPNFTSIVTNADGTLPANQLTIAADGIAGLVRVDVNDITTDLKDVTVTICWKARGGRIIGSCQLGVAGNLQWNNAVSPPQSHCALSTAIARR